eukprot:3572958-Pyramimonas_sp.AAC.1
MAAIGAWAKGWLTSARIVHPDGLLRCRCGCRQPVRLARCLVRPRVRRATGRALGRDLPLALPARLGLVGPKPEMSEEMLVACQLFNMTRGRGDTLVP